MDVVLYNLYNFMLDVVKVKNHDGSTGDLLTARTDTKITKVNEAHFNAAFLRAPWMTHL